VIPLELAVGGNEASDLLPVHAPEVLERYGWTRAFWTVLDEGPVEQSIALLGRAKDRPHHWDAHLVAIDAGAEAGRTEDAEALAYRDGNVYVIGSHFGSKRGPLRPRRAFVARFREADAALAESVPLSVVRNRFRLHRAINDALRAAEDTQTAVGTVAHLRFIHETRLRGTAKAKGWTSRIVDGDLPINVEAAAFTGSGSLLLGLRYPVTVDGAPILVELSDVEVLFNGGAPVISSVRPLAVRPPSGLPLGFRALAPAPGGGYDAVLGSIDALGKSSAVLEDHPGAGEVMCRHVRFDLPVGAGPVPVEPVADLHGFHHVEGVSTVDGETYYITDEDHRVALYAAG
jgi:hypothetical protein